MKFGSVSLIPVYHTVTKMLKKPFRTLVSIIIITLILRNTKCEVFSSIEKLEELVVHQKLIFEELKGFVKVNRNIYLIKKILSWRDELELVDADIAKYIANPLNAFLMIKRCTSDIDLIFNRFPKQSKAFRDKIKNLQPEESDLIGAVEGLLRLQITYKLQSEDFASGIIDGEKTRPELSAHDLFVLGQHACNLGHESFAHKYFLMTFEKIRKDLDPDNEVDIEELTGLIDKTLDRSIQMIPELSEEFVKDNFYSTVKEAILVNQVCRGDVKRTAAEMVELKCRYSSITSFAKLAPFKVEEQNLQPYIILIHGAMSDGEIEHLKNISKSTIQRTTIIGANSKRVTTNSRVSQFSYHYYDDQIIQRVTKRIEDMTGLSQNTSELLQMQNYGIGGHYAAHWDILVRRQEQFESNGNRVASMLFYMSDVEKGGYTIFPYLKLRIQPQKGTAAYWFNLKVSGDDDYFTRHSACPVLLGNKWVANKWIREHGQEFRRPCLPEKFVKTVENDLYKGFF